jgi:hypothetical protein
VVVRGTAVGIAALSFTPSRHSYPSTLVDDGLGTEPPSRFIVGPDGASGVMFETCPAWVGKGDKRDRYGPRTFRIGSLPGSTASWPRHSLARKVRNVSTVARQIKSIYFSLFTPQSPLAGGALAHVAGHRFLLNLDSCLAPVHTAAVAAFRWCHSVG